MSKRFLKLFALVTIFTLAMAGSAFAAAQTVTYTWAGNNDGNGDWGVPGNWNVSDGSNTAPTAAPTAVVVFPQTTGTVTIAPNMHYVVGAIHVDGGQGNARIEIGAGADLQIRGDVTNAANVLSPSIRALGNVIFTGAGAVQFNDGATGGAALLNPDYVDHFASLEVVEGATLTLDLITQSLPAATGVTKTGRGTVAFTGAADNRFDTLTKYFVIREGEVSITRAGHVNNMTTPDDMQVVYDTRSVTGRTATLTAAWADTQRFVFGEDLGVIDTPTAAWDNTTPANRSNRSKLYAHTNGILNVREAGATLVVTENPVTVKPVALGSEHRMIVQGNVPVTGRTITKRGAGTLSVASYAAWEQGLDLNIAEGTVAVDAEGAFRSEPGAASVLGTVGDGLVASVQTGGGNGAIGYYPPFNPAANAPTMLEVGVSPTDVTIAAGAELRVNRNQIFGKITGSTTAGAGTVSVAQERFVYVSDNCEFGGVINGFGGLKVTTNIAAGAFANRDPKDVRVTFEPTGDNPYRGDTEIIGAAMLRVADLVNIGGTSKIYLRAREFGTATFPLTNPTWPTVAGAFFATDNVSFANEFYVDAIASDLTANTFDPTLTATTPAARFMPTAATVFVPMDVRTTDQPIVLTLGGNITYAANNDAFNAATRDYRVLQKSGEGILKILDEGYKGRTGRLNMYIDNGRVEVSEERAFGEGDVWVGFGQASTHPTVYLKNGLNLRNNFWFDKGSAFATDVLDSNRGNTADPAVSVGDIVGSSNLLSSQMDVMIDMPSVKDVAKGDVFNVVGSRSMRQYQPSNVKPTVDSVLGDKAPFNVLISRFMVQFEALNEVDVPVFGALSPASVTGATYDGTIAVTSKTGLKAGSAKVTGASWLTASISGGNILLRGTPPEDFAGVTVDVTVATNGDTANGTSGYVSTQTYEITSGGTPTEATLTGGAITTDATGDKAAPGQEVLFTVGSWTYTDTAGVITQNVPVVYGTPTVTGPATITTNNLATDNAVVVKVNDSAAAETVTLTVPVSYNGINKSASKSISISLPEDAGMATAVVTTPSKPQKGETVKITGKLDPKYDINTLDFIASQAGLTSTITRNADGTFEITFVMPDTDLSYYYTAKTVAGGVLYRSNDYDLAVYVPGPGPTPGDDDDGSSGCDAGFAGLALLLAAPLFFRKRS